MRTYFNFATAFAPPIDTRSGQPEIYNSSSDVRLFLQTPSGMDVILGHPIKASSAKDLRFCRQLENQEEISPHRTKWSFFRDDGNTNSLGHLRVGQS